MKSVPKAKINSQDSSYGVHFVSITPLIVGFNWNFFIPIGVDAKMNQNIIKINFLQRVFSRCGAQNQVRCLNAIHIFNKMSYFWNSISFIWAHSEQRMNATNEMNHTRHIQLTLGRCLGTTMLLHCEICHCLTSNLTLGRFVSFFLLS